MVTTASSPEGRVARGPFTYNVEYLVPWRTRTERPHLYLDHHGYLQFGEHVPTFKGKPLPEAPPIRRKQIAAAGRRSS